MRYIAIPALALVVLGAYVPHAFSDETTSTYQLGSSMGISAQDLVIHLMNVADSRCPSDVTCIWAGQVNVTLAVQSPTSKKIVSLISSPEKSSTAVFGNNTIQIADVQPYPRSGHTISLEDYIVTLKITSVTSSGKIRLVTDSKMCLAGVDTCVMAKRLHLAPLKQIKVGIGALDVECKAGYGLVLKATNNMPSCVTSSTADVLVQRGWAISPDETMKLRMTYEQGS